MTENPDYHKATNAAYNILQNTFPFRLATDISQIIQGFSNIAVHSYSQIALKFEKSFQEFIQQVPSDFGFTIRSKNNDNAIILFNDTKDICTIKFTLAHELGHIVLHHEDDNDVARKEASCFARNILCPISTVRELNLITRPDYMYIFEISEPMSDVAIQYAESDYYYISNTSYKVMADMVTAYMYGYDNVETFFGYKFA